MRRCISIIIFLLIIGGCEDDYTIKKGNIQFSFSSVSGSDGRLESLTEPVAVLLSIEDNNGNSIELNKKILLYSFGNGYVSESLQFATGTFHLTQFIILDAENNAIYATPLEGSEFAASVNDPLPIEFIITKNESTLVTPQVISITSDNTPEDFGYVNFGFKVVSPLPRLAQIKVFEGGLSFTHRADYIYSNNVLDEIKFYYCYPDEQNCALTSLAKFEYTLNNLIDKVSYIDGNSGDTTYAIAYVYEGILMRKKKHYPQYNSPHEIEFFYDQNNRVTHSTFSYSATNYRLSEYTYNENGSITEHIYLDGPNKSGLRFIIDYTFDQYKKPSNFDLGISEWVNLPFNGNATSITLKEIYQNGDPPPDCYVSQAYQYNATGLPECYVTSNPGNCYLGFMDGALVQYFYNQ